MIGRLAGILAFLLIFACAIGAQAQELKVREGVSINVRKGAGTNFPVIAKLPAGARIQQKRIHPQNREWIQIYGFSKAADNGWVHSDFVEWVEPIDWSVKSPNVSIVGTVDARRAFTAVALNPGKNLVASASDGSLLVQIWNMHTGELVRDIAPPFPFENDTLFFVRDDIIALAPKREGPYKDVARVLINVNDGSIVYRGPHALDGPLFPLNDSGIDVLYSFGTSSIHYYDREDYSTFYDLYLWDAVKGFNVHSEVVDIFESLEFGKSVILIDLPPAPETSGERVAAFFDHNLNELDRSEPLPPKGEILGYNEIRSILYIATEDYDVQEFDWLFGDITPLPGVKSYNFRIAHDGSALYPDNSWTTGSTLKVRPADGGDEIAIPTQFRNIDDIHYFDGTIAIVSGSRNTHLNELAAVDIKGRSLLPFGSEARAWIISSLQPVWKIPNMTPQNPDLLRLIGHSAGSYEPEGKRLDLTGLQVVSEQKTSARRIEGSLFPAANGNLYRTVTNSTQLYDPGSQKNYELGYGIELLGKDASGVSTKLFRGDGAWVADAERKRFLAVTEDGELVIVGPEPDALVRLDRTRLHEIIHSHGETEPGKNDGEIMDALLAFSGHASYGNQAFFSEEGEELFLAPRTNSRVSFSVAMNDTWKWINEELRRQGKPTTLEVKDLSNARGLEFKFYRFDVATGAYLGELRPAAEDMSFCARPTFIRQHHLACMEYSDMYVIDIRDGSTVLKIPSQGTSRVETFEPSRDGKFIFAVQESGRLEIVDAHKGNILAILYMFDDGEWLLQAENGFYAASPEGDRYVRAALGVEQTYAIDKFRDALYRPDLVAEILKGDPEGLAREAATRISLERILRSGDAPSIIIKGELTGERVRAEASIRDEGGGIGRIEWRVNGVMQQNSDGETSAVADLFLAAGDNRIELVAYNRDNTIQGRSEQLSFTVADDSVSPPRLFVLALGVDEYRLDPLKLKYAEKDARAVAAAFERAGTGLYGEIFTEVVADEEVTRAALNAKFRTLAKSIRPNDVFVFFSAGHGKTVDGRFFFIPQDFTGTSLASIREQGIGHAAWQEWFSLIPAQKSLLLFDSCESGTLTETVVGRELRFQAASDLLGNATGRALIAASSGTGVALEGYQDHGVFAWSIMDALSHADKDANGLIDIDELAGTIEETVPRIAEEAFGEKQTPQFKAPMKGFNVVRPLESAL